MKKYTKSPQHLRYIQRRARRSLEARLRFKRYRLEKNRIENHLSRSEKKSVHQKRKHQAIGFTEVKAPSVLSFVKNPDEVSEFIYKLRDLEAKKHPVWVVLKNVNEIDYDGITVLLSAVVRFQARRIAFNGDFPKDPTARNIIEESGFFKYIADYKFKDEDHYELTATKIFTHAKKNVDSTLGEKLIEAASKTIWGQPKRCPGVQRVLLELMQNTNNHASFAGEGEKHWWLSAKHIRAERRVFFSFVDYGVGVFRSLQNKKPTDKFYGAFEQLLEKGIKSITQNSTVRLIFS